MTSIIRKYYNPPITFDHRRIWPQKENQNRELQEERQNPKQNPNQNLKERNSLLVDMQSVFQVEQKLLKKFLVKGISPQVK